MNIFLSRISPIQCRDTALALIFLALLLWLCTGRAYWTYTAAGVALFAMLWPSGMVWPARLWFGLAHVLGAVMSRVLLTCIYGAILLPVALVRRCLGKDALRLRAWKNGTASAFLVREHVFSDKDLQNPY